MATSINIRHNGVIYRYYKIGEEYLCKVLVKGEKGSSIRVCKTILPISQEQYQQALQSRS